MSVARRFAAALAVVGTGVLAYAVPASATGSSEGSAEGCISNPTAADLVANLYPRQGIARVRAADGKNICADVLLSVYKVPDTWDGKGFNETAVPQTLIETAAGKVEGTGKLELTVPVPDCGSVQVDLYFPPEITEVGPRGHGSQLIQGYIWKNYADGKPKLCEETTPTPSPSETPSPTPSETPSETPSVTPTETPSVTPSETPSVTPSETPSVTPSTTAPVAPTPSPTEGLGAPIPVPPQATPAAPPVLAETGSDSTVPLIGLGGVLLVAGVGLSVAGRRRRTA